jgi:hypothetical protein
MKDVMKCAIENMPAELYNALVAKPILSIPLEIEPWIKDDGIELPEDICNKIRQALTGFYSGWFFAKLSTRSPKDYFSNLLGEIYPMKRIEDIQDALGGCSMRIFEDLDKAMQNGTQLQLHILPWVYIPPQNEWRCYVKDGKLIAISQYFYNIGFNNFAPNKEKIIAFANQYLSHLPMQDIVMDIVYGEDIYDKGLLELNPYGLSDPCLFTYDELNAMDGSEVAFRYNVMDKVSK